MLRPYIARAAMITQGPICVQPRRITFARFAANDDDAVYVVWHDHECIEGNDWKVLGELAPTLFRDPPSGTETHTSARNPTKRRPLLPQTDGHEIRSRAGVIKPAQPDRPSFVVNAQGYSG
jgi:hypothetical protein